MEETPKLKPGQRLWTRDELILGINLYSKLRFGQLHKGNPQIIDLANLIDRTPSSVALKLVNFASMDPVLQQRGIKGMSNRGNLDREIWNEFYEDWDDAFLRSEQLLAEKKHTTIEALNDIEENDLPKEGIERERLVKARVNQKLFRKIVLSNYNGRCCITGIESPELLVASHIVQWSKDDKNRLNPANGLALNALHDKAFECGLITITEDLTLKVSPQLFKQEKNELIKKNFLEFQGKELFLPKKFMPGIEFLKVHQLRFRE